MGLLAFREVQDSCVLHGYLSGGHIRIWNLRNEADSKFVAVMEDANENSDDSVRPGAQVGTDRFVPARNGGALSAVYSITDDIRSHANHSPEPSKGTNHICIEFQSHR